MGKQQIQVKLMQKTHIFLKYGWERQYLVLVAYLVWRYAAHLNYAIMRVLWRTGFLQIRMQRNKIKPDAIRPSI